MTSTELINVVSSQPIPLTAQAQTNTKSLTSYVHSEGISTEFAKNIQKLQALQLDIQNGIDSTDIGSKLDSIESEIKNIPIHDLKLFNDELIHSIQKYVNKYTMDVDYKPFRTENVDCFPALMEYEMKNARNLLFQYSNLYQNLIKQNLLSISQLKKDSAKARAIPSTTHTTDSKSKQQDPHEIDNQISKYIDSIKSHKINIQRANNRFFETMDLIAHIIQKWIKLCNASIQNIRN